MDDAPPWLDSLARAVVDSLVAHSDFGPLGLQYREDGGREALLYPLPLELVGGPDDGRVVSPAFSLDVDRLRAAFERTDEVLWLPHDEPADGPGGPCLSLRGLFQGQPLRLRVLAFAPPGEGPAGTIDVNARRRPA